jgi:hypothetical protein
VARRGWLVVAPALWKGEAVVDTGIKFDFADRSRNLKQRTQLLDHWQRRQIVVLGAGDIEFAFGLCQ